MQFGQLLQDGFRMRHKWRMRLFERRMQLRRLDGPSLFGNNL